MFSTFIISIDAHICVSGSSRKIKAFLTHIISTFSVMNEIFHFEMLPAYSENLTRFMMFVKMYFLAESSHIYNRFTMETFLKLPWVHKKTIILPTKTQFGK